MDYKNKYEDLKSIFKMKEKTNGYQFDTDILNVPIHPPKFCKDCWSCSYDKDHETFKRMDECWNCKNLYEEYITNIIEHNEYETLEILDHVETSFGSWDSSEIFKVKWTKGDESIFGIIHLAIYYDPNAWDKYSFNNNDWYKEHNIVSYHAYVINRLFDKLKVSENIFDILTNKLEELKETKKLKI